jgi:hypothetical protein
MLADAAGLRSCSLTHLSTHVPCVGERPHGKRSLLVAAEKKKGCVQGRIPLCQTYHPPAAGECRAGAGAGLCLPCALAPARRRTASSHSGAWRAWVKTMRAPEVHARRGARHSQGLRLPQLMGEAEKLGSDPHFPTLKIPLRPRFSATSVNPAVPISLPCLRF